MNTTTLSKMLKKTEWNTYAVDADGEYQVRRDTMGAWSKRTVGSTPALVDAIEGEILFKIAQGAKDRTLMAAGENRGTQPRSVAGADTPIIPAVDMGKVRAVKPSNAEMQQMTERGYRSFDDDADREGSELRAARSLRFHDGPCHAGSNE